MGNGSAGAALMVVIGRGENCGRHDGLVLGPDRRRRSAYALVCAGLFCTSLIDRRSREKRVSAEARNFDIALQQKAAHIPWQAPSYVREIPAGRHIHRRPLCCRENQRW